MGHEARNDQQMLRRTRLHQRTLWNWCVRDVVSNNYEAASTAGPTSIVVCVPEGGRMQVCCVFVVGLRGRATSVPVPAVTEGSSKEMCIMDPLHPVTR